jgi:hypothetical protein
MRRKKRIPDREEARREAELAATRIANEEGAVLQRTSLRRVNYMPAYEALRPIGH